MAEKKSYIYEIIVDTKAGTASINGTAVAMDKLEGKMRKLNAESQKLNNTLQKGTDKTGLAGAAVIELGRGVSDLNYGVTAVANNFSQLMTLMSTLVVTTGSLKNAFAAMWNVMKGPLGVVFIFQIFTTIIEKLAMDSKKAAQGINEIEIAVKNAATELEVYLATAKDVTEKEIKLIELKIEMLQKEAWFRGKLADIQEVNAKKIDLEKKENQELVDWYIKAAIGLTSFLDGSMAATGFGEYMDRVNKEGEGNRLVERMQLNQQFDELMIEFEKESEAFGEYMQDKLDKIFNPKGAGDKNDKVRLVDALTGADADAEHTRLSAFIEKTFDIVEKGREELQESSKNALWSIEFADIYRKANEQVREEEHQKALTLIYNRGIGERKAADDLALHHRMMMFEAIGDGLQSLGFILGRTTQEGKAIAAAGALIETYSAIISQLRNASKIGLPGPVAIAQAIATGLFGFAQVKKIYSVKVPKGGSGGAGAGAVPSDIPIQQPDFNIVGVTRENQIQRTITDALGKPIRAYVTTKDIRSSGELDRNIVRGATVG